MNANIRKNIERDINAVCFLTEITLGRNITGSLPLATK